MVDRQSSPPNPLTQSPNTFAAEPSGTENVRHLDPKNWAEFRGIAHTLLDDIITHIETVADRKVWQSPTAATRARFAHPLPLGPRPLSEVVDDVRSYVMPFATGNAHPLFMGWAHGAGTPVGMLAEMVAGGLNLNCGGRDHVGLEVEKQIVGWMREVFDYPASASGILVTGSSMANFLAVIIAKTRALGTETRKIGMRRASPQLVAYTSREAHGCISQAMEISGIGSENLRRIEVEPTGAMNLEALRASIAVDREAGLQPFLVVATAGTVNTGAIDPLCEIAAIAVAENIWFHVDGAIGALTALSKSLRSLSTGIEMSDSIALDFHKWGHVPYDAGFLLMRDEKVHKDAFAQTTAYLQRSDRGLAAGATWPCDLGPDLSRGFRALKVWMTIETLGAERIGGAIEHGCELARYLAQKLTSNALFALKAPVALNIVCFGIRGANADAVRELVIDLQESGLAAPSWTILQGETVIRCAMFNHRTTKADIDLLVNAILTHPILLGCSR